MAGDDSMVESRGRESAEVRWLGLYVLRQELLIRNETLFFFLSRRMMIASAGFAVLSEMEYSRVNWTFTDKERSLLKKVRQRTDEAEHIAIL